MHRLHHNTGPRAFGGAESAAFAVFRIDDVKLFRIVLYFDYRNVRTEDEAVVTRRAGTARETAPRLSGHRLIAEPLPNLFEVLDSLGDIEGFGFNPRQLLEVSRI